MESSPVGRLRARLDLRPGTRLAIGAAAALVGSTPRMLRYRERLGLLTTARRGGRRCYTERELLALAYAGELERRHRVPPVALAFAMRALADPRLQRELRLLGELGHRLAPASLAALDFDAAKARQLLDLPGPG